MANVQATSVALMAVWNETQEHVLSKVPQWRVADGAVEQVINASSDFTTYSEDGLTSYEVFGATCAAGCFFLHYHHSIDPVTYGYSNPVFDLYYSDKGSAQVTFLASTSMVGIVGGSNDGELYASTDGNAVTFIDTNGSEIKVCFTKTGEVWTASVHPFSTPTKWVVDPVGWLNGSETDIYLRSQDQGSEGFWKTSMLGGGTITKVPVTFGGENLFFTATAKNFYLHPWKHPSDTVYVYLFLAGTDGVLEPSAGFYQLTLGNEVVAAKVYDTITPRIYSRTQTQALLATGSTPETALTYTFGVGVGTIPAGFFDGEPPIVIDGRYSYGGGGGLYTSLVRTTAPVAAKKSYVSGVDYAIEFFEEGKTPAKLTFYESSVGFWVEASAPAPQFNSDFFTDFVKSYEVRGYKA